MVYLLHTVLLHDLQLNFPLPAFISRYMILAPLTYGPLATEILQ